MSTVIIKDYSSDNQAKVDSTGHLYVTTAGGGVASTVDIQDSNGNPIVATNGALDVIQQGFSNGTPALITINTASTILIAANPSRRFLQISNNSGGAIWIQYNAAAVVGRGVKVNNGALYTISGSELWLGQINAISSTTSLQIDLFEGTF